jgi:predicted Zn-dependent protease
LTLAHLKRSDGAIAELRRASELEPERAPYTFVYAVALHSGGQTGNSMTVLEQNLGRHPSDRDIDSALKMRAATGSDHS